MDHFQVVFPRLRTDGLKWSFTGETEAHQILLSRGVTALLADPNMGGTDESSALEGSMLSRAIAYVGVTNHPLLIACSISDHSCV